MMSERRTPLIAAAATVLGATVGAVVAGISGGVIGTLAGAAMGVVVGLSGVRPLVALSVSLGTVIGVVLGRSIVAVLCAPAGCATMEWIAGIATGIGAFVGVGLVVALATRSFEEYGEAVSANGPARDVANEAGDSEQQP